MNQQHPDPIAEGLQHGGQRLVQIVSVVVGAQQALAHRRHRLELVRRVQDEAVRRAEEHAERTASAEARARWSRAHDRKWLRDAKLLDVAEVWGAAVPYAPTNESAARALGKCEERLRDLHPHAVSHYDRHRGEGRQPLEAMTLAAPFFSRDPNVRTGDPAPRREELSEGTGAEWTTRLHGPDRGEWERARQEQRATQLADQLRARFQSDGRTPNPEELRTVLEITTNLPEDIIAKAVPMTRQTHPGRGADVERAAEDFPLSIDEALEMSASRPFETAAAHRPTTQAPDRNRRRNL
ncbi:hypothetical protein F8568_022435 [Actinomadura sp. LD22]|uniref:Uncharacterized protein n=1 Tax=Actinomadura physcomitrii TaxID=2650748 RepID=A0A6I4MBA4_9ACTN|nr:hypothetical protein [Actinomadura physcomitrii]MWA02346.1 hypothetical protein [Actinomadura physcomitrii]MWA03082.1 hypothetical protein [Actinomadura physcomitrii]